jgi:hypothetical protein
MLTLMRLNRRNADSGGDTHRRSRSIAGLIALILAMALLAMVLALASMHTFSGNSDGSTAMLEGQAMSTGHLTLHGWSLSLESFWSIDAVAYAVAIRLVGFRAELMHVVPAIIAMLVVLIGAYLAHEGRRGLAAIAAVATVIALLGLPSQDLAYFLLQGPWHVATALLCVLAFAGLSRGGFRWGWVLAVCFLAAGLLGDLTTLTLGVIPVVMAGLVAMLRCRNWRAGSAAVAAAPASLGLAVLVRSLAAAIGTYSIVNRNVPISASQMEWNLRHVAILIAKLLGVGALPIGVADESLYFQVLHAVGLSAFFVGIVAASIGAIRAVARPRLPSVGTPHPWRIDDLLLMAFLGDVATFVVVSPTSNPNYVRYLTPGVIFGAILAGRVVGRYFASLRRGWPLRLALVTGTVAVAAFGLNVMSYIIKPAPAQPVERLAAFLENHDLTEGIGDYWSASLVTVKTDGAVVVRPVTAQQGGVLLRFDRQSAATWYAGQAFQFFVFDTARPFRNVNTASAASTYGAPSDTFRVGTYRVLIWSHTLSLSSALPPQPDPIRIFWRL